MFRHRQQWLMVVLLAGLAANSPASSLRDFEREISAGTHRSLTGQFIIHEAAPTGERNNSIGDATNLVRLDPTLLTVSCERIKKSLLNELGANDQWRGKIFINLHHSENPDETIVVAPVLFGQQWNYRIELPDLMERSRLVSAVVEVVLLEIAQRGSPQPGQIPAWLSQGLSRDVISSSQMELVLESPKNSENGVTLSRLLVAGRRVDPLTVAHEALRTAPPLTLEELSWPRDGQFEGAAGDAFRSSAQLLVHDLLQLNDGRAAMQALLPELSRHLNWQIAFLRAFHQDFASQLDFEKWWALQVVHFTGRDLSQSWSNEQSWKKLDEILNPEMQVRIEGSELPMHTQVSLQAIIRDWDRSRQTKLLQEKVQQLSLVRMWVSQDLVYLVDAYRQTLETYLKKRDTSFYFPMGHSMYGPLPDVVARDTLRQLDELEAAREKLHSELQPDPSVTASVSVNN